MTIITAATSQIGSKTTAILMAERKKIKLITREPEKLENLRKQSTLVCSSRYG